MIEATKSTVDPITVDVLMHRLDAVTAHMADTLVRTCYSPIFYDMNDFSTALFDREGRLIAQSIGCPVHLAAMPASVASALEEFGEQDLHPGDTILLNDPYRGGSHLPDLTFVTPVHFDGELVGFAGTRAHVVDIGGTAPGSMYAQAVEIVQEGLRIPPVKIYAGGQPARDAWEIVIANTRLPHWLAGDVRAAVAANDMGRRYFIELFEKYGKQVLLGSVDAMLAYAERRMRAAIAAIPDGTYQAEDFIDCDGVDPDPIRVRVRITVDGDRMEVDWTGSNPPVKGPVNRPRHAAIGDTMFALKSVLDPEGPANAGWFRPVEVVIPDQCFLNAQWPSPVFNGNLETAGRITDVIWQALGQALPDRIEGMTYGGCNAVLFGGTDPRTGIPYVVADVPPGGWGARATKDGLHTTFHLLGNCRDMPIEVAELLHPLRVERTEYRPDSGGGGRHRGGLGLLREYRFLDHNVMFGVESSRSIDGPPGVFGGEAGAPMRLVLCSPDGDEEVVAGMTDAGEWKMCIANVNVPANWSVRMESAGGGGYGDPLERDVTLVERDVRGGLVSLEQARALYGVVLDPETLDVHSDETAAQRAALLAGRAA
ncbi:MAG TPA: hydantoinase B/oxoprolinase family protein [Solirubrobacter sp.]|nr:hydantoinase B/oxoprolinase family protein [Solirubrobacter sp.]